MFCLQQLNYRITKNGEEMINSYMLRHTLLWGVLLRKFSIVIAFFASAWQILNSLSEIISVFFCNPDFLTQLNAHKNRVINKPFHSSFGQNGPFKCYPLESEQLYVIKKIKEMIIKKIK